MNKFLYRNALAIAVLAALGSETVHAQAPTTEAPTTEAATTEAARTKAAKTEDTTQLATVKVTAQRREEAAQKTPISISVISGEQLERMQVTRIDDVKFKVPNIIVEQNTGTSSGAKIFMRGIGADESMFTNDPAVAIYIDDVYIPRQNGAMFDLYDVDRIEVLRGPQGTLYGRNSTGGAIRYITRKPKGEERLAVSATLGNFNRKDLKVNYETRIGTSVDVSAAVMSRKRDGYMHDLTHDRWINDTDVLAGRLSLTSPVGEASTATLSFDTLKERSTPTGPTPVQLVGGVVVPKLGSFFETRTDTLGQNDLDQAGASLVFDTDYDSFFVRHILHYRKLDQTLYMDVDGTEQMRYHLFQGQKQSQRGYEAQVTSQTDGKFHWVGGFFSFWESNAQPTRNDIFAKGATNYVAQDTAALAGYLQGTYDLTDKMTFTAGGRYSYEKKDFSVVAINANGTPRFSVAKDKSWTRPDWKLMLDYEFTDNIMGYASVTTGFKSGGFNGRGTSAATITTVDAEEMMAYEAGLKSSLLDNRLRLNANFYRLDYSGLQLSAVDPNGVFVVTNATGALIQGVELELQAQLTRNWNINAGLGTVDAKYQGFAAVNAARFAGKSLKNAPKLQWQFDTTYIREVGNADLVMSAQVKYTDEYFQNQDLSHLIMTKANKQANARISYEPKDANWSVALWGKNLTNTRVSSGGFDIPGLGIGVFWPNLPRTYGVDFNYRFW